MINPFKVLAAYGDLNKMSAVAKEKTTMNQKVTQIVMLLVSMIGAVGVPEMAANWVHAHMAVYIGFVAAAILLHAVFPSVFAAPSAADEKATGFTKAGIVLLMLGVSLMCAVPVRAQTSTPTPQPSFPVLFTPSSQAMGFELGGNYAVGTDLAETLNITKSCGIEGHQILVPSMNLQAYLGGVACTPDFSKLLAKTVLPTDTINFSFRGAAGIVRNTTGSVIVSNPSFLAGGCVSFNPGSKAVVVPTCFDYFRAPGFGPSANGMTFSAGIAYVFGH